MASVFVIIFVLLLGADLQRGFVSGVPLSEQMCILGNGDPYCSRIFSFTIYISLIWIVVMSLALLASRRGGDDD